MSTGNIETKKGPGVCINATEKILIAGPSVGPIPELLHALERILGGLSGIEVITCPEQGLIWFSQTAWRAALVHVDWMLGWSARGSLLKSRAAGNRARVTIVYGDDPLTLSLPAYLNLLALGATDVLESPGASFIDAALEAIVGARMPAVTGVPAGAELDSLFAEIGIVGQGPLMHEIYREVHAAALHSDVPVLISGESGTGKQLLAEAIHRLDPVRASKPMVTVNCSAITDTLAESELFGHRKGSFTGAVESRRGCFRSAHGGTLFLDEVGELSLRLQPKLLRALEQKVVVPVGDDREEYVDLRVIAATNRDLGEMVAKGEFRMDLYQRLNVAAINVPPLRERPEDIVPLIQFFGDKHGHPIHAVESRVTDILLAHGLPGNVRELENLIRRILFMTGFSGVRLRASDLPAELLHKVGKETPEMDLGWELLSRGLFHQLLHSNLTLEQLLNVCDLVVVREALQKSAGNRQAAARILQTTERTVFNKIRKHHLSAIAPRPGPDQSGSPGAPATPFQA